MNENLIKHINDTKKIIYKIASKYSYYYDIEDLYQVGVIGVIKAYKNYNTQSEAKFTTYAYSYILGEILEFVKNDRNMRINSETLKLYKSYQKTLEYLAQKESRLPSFYEISEFMNVPEDVLYNAIIASEATLSLDNEINNNSFHEIIGEDGRDNLDNIISLRNELAKLNSIDREIIKCRYYKDYTQSETASYLGMSQVQISRNEKNILTRIKEKIAN